MRHSIVIPTYRRPQRLRETLRAVCALEYPRHDFEVIVVDDGDCERTAAAVAKEGAPVGARYVARPQRGGPARARNVGASLASGEYLAFLDDDVIPLSDWLARFDEAIASTADQPVAFGGRTINAESNTVFGIASQNVVDFLYAWHNRDPNDAGFFATNNLVCGRVAFLFIGGFDESFRSAAAEDRDFCDRWREHGRRLVFVSDAVVRHHQRSTFADFFRQHVVYGRGAVDLHLARDRRGVERPHLEPSRFYSSLLLFPLSTARGWRLPVLLMLGSVTQVAYAWGFFTERWRRRRQRPDPLTHPVLGPPPEEETPTERDERGARDHRHAAP